MIDELDIRLDEYNYEDKTTVIRFNEEDAITKDFNFKGEMIFPH